jgi:hypothetical protein
VRTTPKGPNPYGPSQGGGLIAKGQLLPVYYVLERNVWRPLVEPFYHEDPKVEPEVHFDVLDEGLRIIPDDHGTYSILFPEGDYFFLRAAIYISGGVWSTATRENVCLLLRQRADTPGGLEMFSRAGFVMFGFSSDTVWESGAAPQRSIVVV